MDDRVVEFANLARMSVTYARRHFSEFLDRTESGEHIVITRNGKDWAVAASDPIRRALSDQCLNVDAPRAEAPTRSPR